MRVEASVPLAAADAWELLVEGMAGWWPEGPEVLGVGELDPPRAATCAWAADGSTVVLRVASVEDDLSTVIVEHHYQDDAVREWAAGADGWWAVLRAYVAAARPAQ